jgi:hypothetical protein
LKTVCFEYRILCGVQQEGIETIRRVDGEEDEVVVERHCVARIRERVGGKRDARQLAPSVRVRVVLGAGLESIS